MILDLESGIIYGPIHSRRLGLSLGVNLLPLDRKVCSFDCVYCHYGATHVKTLRPEGIGFPAPFDVLMAIEAALRRYPAVEYLTFSGNGEPTLHPEFAAIAAQTKVLRDALRPEVKLALFSNATTVDRREIRQALSWFDAPILKLDAGDPETLAAISRPAGDVRLETIIAGMKAVRNLITQTVLIDGPLANCRGPAFEAWSTALAEIRPREAQIYSTDYPVPDAGIERVPPFELKRIAAEVRTRTGVTANAYWG